MRKSFIAIGVALALLASGCGDTSSTESEKPAPASTSSATDKKSSDDKNPSAVSDGSSARKESTDSAPKPKTPAPKATTWTEKMKMDFLIPLANKHSLNEAALREVVRIMDECGVDFTLLQWTKLGNMEFGQISIRAKNVWYNPSLRLEFDDKILTELSVNLYGQPDGRENNFCLYANHQGTPLSRKAFSEVFVTDALKNDIKRQVDAYLNEKHGKLKSDPTAANMLEPFVVLPGDKNVYSNFTDEELISTQIAYAVRFLYDAKSEVYGKGDEEHSFTGVYFDGQLIEVK